MIEQLFITSLVIIAIHILFLQGNILQHAKPYLDKHCPLVFQNPLYNCLPCMASIWGTVAWFAIHGVDVEFWIDNMKWYLIFIFSLSGLLYLTDIFANYCISLINENQE